MTNFSLGWRATWRWFAVAFVLSLLVSASGQGAGIFNTTGSFTNSEFCGLYRCPVPKKRPEKDGTTTWVYELAKGRVFIQVNRTKGGKVLFVLTSIRRVHEMDQSDINLIASLMVETLFSGRTSEIINIGEECSEPAVSRFEVYWGKIYDFPYNGVMARVYCVRTEGIPSQSGDPSLFPVISIMARQKDANEPFGDFIK
jgi:hypothetical protein